MQIPTLYIVIPCYNEKEVLPHTVPMFCEELCELMQKNMISVKSRLLFVDDGSTDSTWSIILDLAKKDHNIEGVLLSRNCGHQNALFAGMTEACDKCDILITADCDGQDDICAIEKMVECYHNGYDIVYGVRSDRKKDNFFKRFSARMFYKLLRLMGVDTVYDHADYRLMTAAAVKALLQFTEVNLYLRGIVPLVGFKSTTVQYERKERRGGKSHYSLKKMLALAIDAVTGFSVRPLRIISFIGFFVSFLSFIGIIWALIQYFTGNTVSGWASTLCILCFVSGVQLVSTGVVGEYIGKIYMEVKQRPKYIISKRIVNAGDENEDK